MLSRPQQILLHLHGHLWIHDIVFVHVPFHQHVMFAGQTVLCQSLKSFLRFHMCSANNQSFLTGFNKYTKYTFQFFGKVTF